MGAKAKAENFPVALRLLGGRRHAVVAFYAWARTADDVADDPAATPEAKLARLERLDQALAEDRPPGEPALDRALERLDGGARGHLRTLLRAFGRDARNEPVATWDDLLGYCRLSADPVGRFLLGLHGEGDPRAVRASDALCTSLQVLNHLQDMGQDWRALRRCYLPAERMEARGVAADDLLAPASSPGLAALRRELLARLDPLLAEADALPGLILGRGAAGLRAQAAATLLLAWRLRDLLEANDPLAGRVAPSKADKLKAAGVALKAYTAAPADRPDPALAKARAAVAREVAQAGTSFYWGMRLLPYERRHGMLALYAYCRRVDDIADGEDGAEPEAGFTPAAGVERPAAELGWPSDATETAGPSTDDPEQNPRLAALALWEQALLALDAGTAPPPALARDPALIALADAKRRFALPTLELLEVLEGCRADAVGIVRAPPEAELSLYRDRVAGAVGALSVRVFGRPDAQAFARGLGDAFQRVNILRDLEEDAAIGRLYVAAEDLEAAGIDPTVEPGAVLADPRFAQVHAKLLADAEAAFARARAEWQAAGPEGLRPALLMAARYREILDRARKAGWPRDPSTLKPGKAAKAGILLRTLARPGWPESRRR